MTPIPLCVGTYLHLMLRALIRHILQEAYVDADGRLMGLSAPRNKFYNHKVAGVMRRFLVDGDEECKHPFLKRDNHLTQALSGAKHVSGHPHVRVFQPNGHVYDYIMLKGKVYPAYFFGSKVDFNAHLKDIGSVRSIEDLDIHHFGNDFAGPEVRALQSEFPQFSGDPARGEVGREMIMDLFDILDITSKSYVGYFNDTNRYKKDGSIDGKRIGIDHKLYNFIE